MSNRPKSSFQHFVAASLLAALEPLFQGDHLLQRRYRTPIYADDNDQEDDHQQPENDCNNAGKTGDLAEGTTPSTVRTGEFGRAHFHYSIRVQNIGTGKPAMASRSQFQASRRVFVSQTPNLLAVTAGTNGGRLIPTRGYAAAVSLWLDGFPGLPPGLEELEWRHGHPDTSDDAYPTQISPILRAVQYGRSQVQPSGW